MALRYPRQAAAGVRSLFLLAAAVLVMIFATPIALAQENEDCLMCHEDPELVGERGGVEVSMFVDPQGFTASVHQEFGCIDCHMDLDGVELPHDEELDPVDCAMCHDDVGEELSGGPHGKWAENPVSPSADARPVTAPTTFCRQTIRRRRSVRRIPTSCAGVATPVK